MKKKSTRTKLFVAVFGVMACALMPAVAGTLEWVGASGGTWDTTTQNWRDENGDPSAWVDGSTAVFGDNGGASISIASSVTNTLGGLVFRGSTMPTISGGTLKFNSQIPIDMQTYKGATISSQLLTPNGFVANFVQPTCDHSGFLPCKGTANYDWTTGVPVTLWKNCNLADLDIKSAYIYTWRMTPLFARAYNHNWVDGKLRLQFQYDTKGNDGIYAVHVEFAQDGDDVTARVLYCRAKKTDDDGNLLQVGDDFYSSNVSGGAARVLDGVLFTDTGLGVKGGEIVAEPKAPLQISGTWTTPVGTCVVSNGALQITGKGHIFSAGDSFQGNGTLIVKNTQTSSQSVKFTSSFQNSLTGGLIVDKAYMLLNGEGSFSPKKACGPGCPIRVINGGFLFCYRWANESIGGSDYSGVTMYIGTNSTVRSYVAHRNLQQVQTVVDGGKIQVDGGSSGAAYGLILRNGAQVVDDNAANMTDCLSFGYTTSTGREDAKPRIRVDGNDAITVAARIRIMKNPNGSYSADQQYTTFDTRADLQLTGGILNSPAANPNYAGLRVRKCGVAKMILDYSQTDFPADSQTENKIEFCVDQGTLELRKSNAIVSTQALSLYGAGEVTLAANVSTDVAKLTIGGTNTIDFAAGSVLTCTNLTFTAAAKKLNLTGEVGDRSFRVGTTKCLTTAQLAQVRINGHHAVQDQNGYLIQGGLAMVIR